jgi:serine/threonine protein kinase
MPKYSWLPNKSTGEAFAMKVLKKSQMENQKDIARVFNEKEIIKDINHPFIVKLHYTFQTKTKVYFILDLLTGGDLYTHIEKKGKFKEQQARFYAAEIVLALDHLHQQGIVYRDLKPQNIVIDNEGHIKLTDFGLSKKDFDQDQENTI